MKQQRDKNSKHFRIGSFNVLNYKTRTKDQNADEFKDKKLKKIADFIANQEFSVIALQEVKGENTVKDLVEKTQLCNLYAYVHCEDLYKELSEKFGEKSSKEIEESGVVKSQSKGELAFVYKRSELELVTDVDFYHEISQSVNSAYARLVDGLTIAVVGCLVATSLTKDVRSKADKEGMKKKGLKRLGAGGAVLGLSKYVESKLGAGKVSEKGALKDSVKDVISAIFRPPLIAAFKSLDGRNVDIRLINIHSRFRFLETGKTDIKGRQDEMKVIAGDVFSAVKSQPTGEFRTAYTFVAGDFNLEPKHLNMEQWGLGAKRGIAQKEKSTLRLVNLKDVEDKGDEPVYETVHSYDHFIYDKDLFPKESDVEVAVLMEADEFFVGTGANKRAISDHYPIRICVD